MNSAQLKRNTLRLLISLAFFLPAFAQATVDAAIEYFVYRQAIHTSGYCEVRLPMIAEFGVPADPYIQGLFAKAPMAHHRIGAPLTFENINVLHNQGFTYQLQDEEYIESEGVWLYKMRLNLPQLSSNTTAKRADLITKTKLTIIGINASLREATSPYKLELRISGLPSQQGLSGARVYSQTQYPYTSGSTLVRQYRQELLNVEGECD